MAKNRRNTPKKENEELLVDIVEVKESSQDFLEKNKGIVIALVAGLLLLVGGYLVYKYLFQAPKEKAAANAIYKAEAQFERDSFALALENPGGGFEGFLDIIENYPGTKTANISKYYAGISYLNLGRYEDAVKYLGSFSSGGNITPIMKNGAMGDAYSELGDFDKAISMYSKAASAKNNEFLTPYYLMKLGMLQQKQGDNAAAAKAFNTIKENFPASSQGADIDRYLAQVQ